MQVINPKKINYESLNVGAGETLACGSGACAAAIAGRLQNLLSEKVTVSQQAVH